MKTSIVLIAKIKCCRLAENPAVYEKVIALLRNNNVQYEEMVHPPVKTSAEVWIQSGAKAILVKNSKGTWLLVISAAKQIDWHLAKNIVKRTSLVPREEVPSVTGCVPGAVPPFGSLLGDHPIHTFVDTSLKEQGEYIYFNAVSTQFVL